MVEHDVIVTFLAENWQQFVNFCEERGEDAEDLYQAIGGEPE